jgi:hypothetical protein
MLNEISDINSELVKFCLADISALCGHKYGYQNKNRDDCTMWNELCDLYGAPVKGKE